MPSILTRRVLSPEKLRRIRLEKNLKKAQVARVIGLRRLAYSRWERAPVIKSFDYVAFHNLLVLYGVSYQDVTDPLPEEVDDPYLALLPAPAAALAPAPQQAPA